MTKWVLTTSTIGCSKRRKIQPTRPGCNSLSTLIDVEASAFRSLRRSARTLPGTSAATWFDHAQKVDFSSVQFRTTHPVTPCSVAPRTGSLPSHRNTDCSPLPTVWCLCRSDRRGSCCPSATACYCPQCLPLPLHLHCTACAELTHHETPNQAPDSRNRSTPSFTVLSNRLLTHHVRDKPSACAVSIGGSRYLATGWPSKRSFRCDVTTGGEDGVASTCCDPNVPDRS